LAGEAGAVALRSGGSGACRSVVSSWLAGGRIGVARMVRRAEALDEEALADGLTRRLAAAKAVPIENAAAANASQPTIACLRGPVLQPGRLSTPVVEWLGREMCLSPPHARVPRQP
jgi:hypothetical protein